MARERQLGARGEDADPRGAALLGREDEDGLREVRLAGDGLHRLVVEPSSVREDRERVAGQGTIGEDVGDDVAVETPRGRLQGCARRARVLLARPPTSRGAPAPSPRERRRRVMPRSACRVDGWITARYRCPTSRPTEASVRSSWTVPVPSKRKRWSRSPSQRKNPETTKRTANAAVSERVELLARVEAALRRASAAEPAPVVGVE